MRTLFTLDPVGLISAASLGVALLLLGGFPMGVYFLLVMLYFLILSAIVTRMGSTRKKVLGVYEHSRGWRNVIANGSAPLLMAGLFFVNSYYGMVGPSILVLGYVAGVAAITADKFASEIGVLGKAPIMLLTLKKTKRGVSGGVTVLGFAFSLIAAVFISASVFFMPIHGNFTLYFFIAVFAAFIGNLADSVFGYFEEQGIGNKYTSNLACALAGTAVAIIIALML